MLDWQEDQRAISGWGQGFLVPVKTPGFVVTLLLGMQAWMLIFHTKRSMDIEYHLVKKYFNNRIIFKRSVGAHRITSYAKEVYSIS